MKSLPPADRVIHISSLRLYHSLMSLPEQNAQIGSRGSERFRTTQWSVVLAAGRRSSPDARDALATLCQVYWYPLYAYVRRKGHSPNDAQDLTQDFFARLLEKNIAGKADRTRGRFRSFLLASLNHFLAKEWRRAAPGSMATGESPSRLILQGARAATCWSPRTSLPRRRSLSGAGP